MGKVILYIATTKDGFIADENGDVDFLTKFNDIDYGFENFFKDIDVCIMGAKTYLKVLSFGLGWPYIGKQSIVYATRDLVVQNDVDISFRRSIDWGEIDELKTNKNIWLVGGARITSQFIDKDKIDILEIFEMPVYVSSGIALGVKKDKFIVIKEKEYSNGVKQKVYRRRSD